MATTRTNQAAAKRTASPIHGNLPGSVVTTPRNPWRSETSAIAGLTVMTCGLVSIDGAGAAGVGMVAGVGAMAGAGRAVHGIRRRYHDILTTQLTVTLARDLDMGVRVRLHRWRGSPKGDPTRVSIRYPLERAIEPTLEAKIAAVGRQVLGAPVEVLRHDRRQGYLLLGRVTVDREIEKTEQQVTFERGCNIIRQMLGAEAAIEAAHDKAGTLIAFKVKHQAGVRVANANRRAYVERVCTTMLPGRWRAKWSLETDQVTLELRPTLPTSVPHHLEPITAENYWRLPYAIDEDGNVISWDLASSSPHHMVCGRSGTGKTAQIRTLVTEATRDGRNWRVWIIDPKRVEFLDLRDWPNIQIVATAIVAMVMVIYRAWQEMEDRYARIERDEIDPDDLEPLVLVLDEYRDFVGMINAWWQQVKNVGHPNRCPVFENVSSVARKGRKARVHLVLGTQRPDAEFLGGEALALDTPIPTPTGWSTMADLKVGDLVYAEDGRPVRVTATSKVATGRPCYRVTFTDGSSVVTDERHLWVVQDAKQRVGDGKSQRARRRAERWPAHATLAQALAAFNADDAAEVTVPEFEAKISEGRRIPLLRRILHDGRAGVRPVSRRPGAMGRFGANVYRFGDLRTALLNEVRQPAPTWRRATRIVTTGEMAAALRYRDRERMWSVEAAKPLTMPEADLPIDPWLLGYWLGDGYKNDARIATNDPEVLERIRSLGYTVVHHARYNYGITTGPRGGIHGRPTLKGALRQLGVLGNKHVPDVYLRASESQRAALLAGLLDADGTCAVRRRGNGALSGQVSFSNTDRRLIDAVVELAAGLGFVPTVRMTRDAGVETHASSVAYGRPLRRAWRVSFTPDRNVFNITRKREKLAPALEFPRRPTTRRRYVESVEPVDSVAVRCITVDSPRHLYLCGRTFIPTHNTRDNFDSRTSVGPLSPQGAQMMWEASYIGVAIPRRIRGRATAMDDDGRPVEAQVMWTPEQRHAERSANTADLDLLAALRPTVIKHHPLAVKLDETWLEPDRCDKNGRPRLLDAIQHGRLVEYDPSHPLPRLPATDAGDLGSNESDDTAGLGDADDPGASVEIDLDSLYDQPERVPASEVAEGDLIEADDEWVAVEAAVEDQLDSGLIDIDWRSFDDEFGSMQMSVEEVVDIRRPFSDVDGSTEEEHELALT